jgi:hypothetical protein
VGILSRCPALILLDGVIVAGHDDIVDHDGTRFGDGLYRSNILNNLT